MIYTFFFLILPRRPSPLIRVPDHVYRLSSALYTTHFTAGGLQEETRKRLILLPNQDFGKTVSKIFILLLLFGNERNTSTLRFRYTLINSKFTTKKNK